MTSHFLLKIYQNPLEASDHPRLQYEKAVHFPPIYWDQSHGSLPNLFLLRLRYLNELNPFFGYLDRDRQSIYWKVQVKPHGRNQLFFQLNKESMMK